MDTNTANHITEGNQLEMLFRLIERYDSLRGTIANRAAIVLSANALLLGATTFLIDRLLLNSTQIFIWQLIFALCIALIVVFLTLSIVQAARVIANVWRTSREILDIKSPERLFFHAKETVEKFSRFEDFEHGFKNITQSQLITHALSELWSLEKNYIRRYRILSQAIKYFLLSIFPFVISIGIMLIQSL